MRSLFYVLSDDHIGSTPRFAPGSQVKPSEQPADAGNAAETDDVVVDMEVSAGSGATPKAHTPLTGLSQQLKRKSGDVFSGTSKQRVLSQESVPESLR
jgi:hypothetical protein